MQVFFIIEEFTERKYMVHCPVMLEQVIEFLSPQGDEVHVDMTIGAGGHSRAILEKLDGGRLLGLDRDEEILEFAKKNLKEVGENFSLHCRPFSYLPKILKEEKIEKINGVLFDLGVSSLQLDQPNRGFSFLREGPLDMRMGHNKVSAAQIVNKYPEKELAHIIWKYGEERRSRRIAKAIVENRRKKPIQSTLELANIVSKALGYTQGRIHPATRTFQGLRIEVNDELKMLEQTLEAILPFLAPGGRIVVISFHSLEDRIVKHFFRAHKEELDILTKKPLMADRREQHANPRSRSAKLRCARLKNEQEK